MVEIKAIVVSERNLVITNGGEYVLALDNMPLQRLSCTEDTNFDLVIDQVNRHCYFTFGYNVIYSQYFYSGNSVPHYGLRGFFRSG